MANGDEWRALDEGQCPAQLDELGPFLDLPMEVGVQLGQRRITFGEVLKLQPGSVIRMNRSAGENADLLLERRKVGRGEIVVIEDMMGLRITELGDAGPRREAKQEDQ